LRERRKKMRVTVAVCLILAAFSSLSTLTVFNSYASILPADASITDTTTSPMPTQPTTICVLVGDTTGRATIDRIVCSPPLEAAPTTITTWITTIQAPPIIVTHAPREAPIYEPDLMTTAVLWLGVLCFSVLVLIIIFGPLRKALSELNLKG